MTERKLVRVGLVSLAVAVLCAQEAAPPAFEVAAVKQSAAGSDAKGGWGGDPGRIDYRAVSLGALLMKAYELRSFQVTGPDWLWTGRFDVVAKLPAGANPKQIPLMLRTLLTERFQLAMHREPKELPVYQLVIAKTGLKSAPSSKAEAAIQLTMTTTTRKLSGIAGFSALANSITVLVDRPVLDATEAPGIYDIDLQWERDEREAGSIIGMKVAMAGDRGGKPLKEGTDPAAGGSLTNALRDSLGLRLEPRKSMVEILIVDRASRVPAEN